MSADTLTTAVCSSCGAAIVWAVTERGRRMPLDAGPVAEPVGFILRREHEGATGLRAIPAQPVYRSHFASCPDADRHRRTHAR